jgi:hypothetical protein
LLENVLDHFVWEFNIPISSYSFESVESSDGDATVFTKTVRLSALYAIAQSIPLEKCERISQEMTNDLNDDKQKIISMYRQTVSCDSPHLKFLLSWRLLEEIFNNTSDIDDWIKIEKPEVEMMTDSRGDDYTIYRYLRKTLHSGEEDKFPFEEIEIHSTSLLNVVRTAIKQKIL